MSSACGCTVPAAHLKFEAFISKPMSKLKSSNILISEMPCCVNNIATLHPMTLYWAGDMKAKLFAPALYEAEGQSHKPPPTPIDKSVMTYDIIIQYTL
jgi:hypothetical protein